MSPNTLDGGVGRVDRAATTVRSLGGAARRLAFWVAVAMPLAHLHVLLGGPLTAADLAVVAGLVAGNVVALVAGHGHAGGAGTESADPR